MEMIKAFESGTLKKSQIAKLYNIPLTTLIQLLSNKEKIIAAYTKTNGTMMRIRPGAYGDVDHALYEWYNDMRNSGVELNRVNLQKQAAVIARARGHKDDIK